MNDDIGAQHPLPSDPSSFSEVPAGQHLTLGRMAEILRDAGCRIYVAPPVTDQPDALWDDYEGAAVAAWDFVRPKLTELNREKGPAGVWSNAFRSGWIAASRLASPAPADNGDTSQHDDLDLAKIEASIDRGARRTDHRFRLDDPVATPSPIEDVAGPSEVGVEIVSATDVQEAIGHLENIGPVPTHDAYNDRRQLLIGITKALNALRDALVAAKENPNGRI